MKIALTTIGCKLNQAEIQNLKKELQAVGYLIVEKTQNHDLHIINACSITHGAEQITRQKIREIKRANPQAQIFVIGCYNQKIPEVTKVFKTPIQIFEYIKKNHPIPNSNLKTSSFILQPSKTRALVKIQDGCNFNCTYCIITKFRGKSKSISPAIIFRQIEAREKQGCQEIVLVGVNILLYKFKKTDFVSLVKQILKETKIPRIRFSSLDPRLISADFLALLKNPRVCPHLHLSLQSGSDKILKLMNRHYTIAQYYNITKQARRINPLTSFTTDIIVGFPNETDQDFQNTLKFIKKIDFLKIHIFPYSKRSGTRAAVLKTQIDDKIKKQRFQALNHLAQGQKNIFLQKMKGKVMPVLFEGKKFGYTPNYIPIPKKLSQNLKNKIIKVKI